MLLHSRLVTGLLILLLLSSTIPVHAQPKASDRSLLFMPLISMTPPPNPFGFDLRIYSSADALSYGAATRPKWARAGDADWSLVEPTPGVYNWDALAEFESNVRRLRAAGIEPIGIIQRTPAWAQSVAGRACSPPSRDHIADLARFTQALAAHYSRGDLAVNYWEFWNEPDFAPNRVADHLGVGCWGDESTSDNGGKYYGEILNQVYPAIKSGNARANLFAGAFASFGPGDPRTERFARGMLAVAPTSFDALSFHAYGEWSKGDLLLTKTLFFRKLLREYGIQDTPLVATEIAATCESDATDSCKPNYDEWLSRQANFAARIYAEALALNLVGAFWYTLDSENPGFAYSHLLDRVNGQTVPRPAYYAFRNSARLLAGGSYIGSPLVELAPDQFEDVQVLPFRKFNSTMYVMWVPRLDFPKTTYILYVQPGARAICTQRLSLDKPYQFDCSDTNKDGIINLAVISVPQYVEVFD